MKKEAEEIKNASYFRSNRSAVRLSGCSAALLSWRGVARQMLRNKRGAA